MGKKDKKTWEEFEEIVFKVLLDLFGVKEGHKNQLTRSTKDGGYDGVFWLPFSSNNENYVHIIFEAKLRNNLHTSLPLQEFAKALIIAINRSADHIIIASNLRLSAGTENILTEFSQNTGLGIEYLPIDQVQTWLDMHPDEKKLYSSEILNILRKSDILKEPDKSKFLQNIFANSSPQYSLFCDAHKKARDQMLRRLNNGIGTIIVIGHVGSGKTTIIRSLIEVLANSGTKACEFDLSVIFTPRNLFMQIMQSIWRLPIELIQKMDSDDFAAAISDIGTVPIENRIKTVVQIAFQKSVSEYSDSSDVFNYYLVSYLKLIYNQISKTQKVVLCFTGLNYASKDILDFLFLFATTMTGKVNIILEIRSSLYIDDNMKIEEWEEYKNKFLNLPHIYYKYTPEIPELEEYSNYINKTLNYDIPSDYINIILNKTGNTLLNINAFIEYLRITNWRNCPDILKKGILQDIALDTPTAALRLLCTTLCKKDKYFIKLFFITDVFKGEFPINLLKDSIGYENTKIDYLLQETDIFELINLKTLRVKHSCYIDTLKDMPYISDTLKQELARMLLDNDVISCYVRNKQQADIIRIYLYEQLNLYKKVIWLSLWFSIKMYRQGMYSLSLKYSLKAEENLKKIGNSNTFEKWEKILVSSMLLQNEIHSQTLSDDRLHRIITNTEKLFKDDSIKEHNNYALIYLIFLLIKNRIYHLEGNYVQTYKNMKTSVQFMKCVSDELPENIKGQCWLEYAIAIKENYSLEPCLKVFRRARKDCPHNIGLLFSNLTHISEKYSTYSPKIAIKSLLLIERFKSQLPKASVFHNQTNLGFMRLYLGEYQTAFQIAQKTIHDINEIGIKNEESRCCNLLGCLYFIENDYEQARKTFEYAMQNLDCVHQITTLWPILVNLSSLLLEIEEFEEAGQILNNCLNIYVTHYQNRVKNFHFNEPKFPKIFIGILTVFEGLMTIKKKANEKLLTDHAAQNILRLQQTFTSAQFEKYYSNIINGYSLKELLESTPFIQKNHIIIKT